MYKKKLSHARICAEKDTAMASAGYELLENNVLPNKYTEI